MVCRDVVTGSKRADKLRSVPWIMSSIISCFHYFRFFCEDETSTTYNHNYRLFKSRLSSCEEIWNSLEILVCESCSTYKDTETNPKLTLQRMVFNLARPSIVSTWFLRWVHSYRQDCILSTKDLPEPSQSHSPITYIAMSLSTLDNTTTFPSSWLVSILIVGCRSHTSRVYYYQTSGNRKYGDAKGWSGAKA